MRETKDPFQEKKKQEKENGLCKHRLVRLVPRHKWRSVPSPSSGKSAEDLKSKGKG